MEFKLTKHSQPLSLSLSRKKRAEVSAANSTIGLDIEADSVAASEAGNGSAGRTAIAPLPRGIFGDGEIKDPEALTAALRSLFAENRLGRTVRVGVANQSVVVRTLKLPLIEDEKELETAIRFQAHDQIPMPLDQAVLDHRVLRRQSGPEGDRQMDVLVVAARRDMIATLLDSVREAGLVPAGIDLSAFGMIRALEGGAGEAALEDGSIGTTTLYCYFGAATNLVVANGRDCLFTRTSPIGIERFAEAVAAREEIPVDEARDWLLEVGLTEPLDESFGDDLTRATVVREALQEGASKLVSELRLSLDYYGAQEGALPIERVVACGLGTTIPGMMDHLRDGLGRDIEARRPQALSHLDEEDAARLTIPYGLALEG